MVGRCELLRSNGHTGDLNPDYYPIKKLIAHSNLCKKIRVAEMVSSIVANHSSRVACATGDVKAFNKVISQLTEE